MKRIGNCRGFTLIEIMVVVFIIGLLATLASQNVINYIEGARRTKAAADIQTFAGALQMFQLDNAAYPSTNDGLSALIQPPPGAANLGAGPYVKKVSPDPWGNPYAYESDRREYDLASHARDGKAGGEGWDADVRSDDL